MAVWLVATAYGVGRRVMRRLGLDAPGDRHLALPLGLGTIGLLLFVLGVGGRLSPLWVAVLLAGLGLVALPAWRELVAEGSRPLWGTPSRWRRAVWILLAGVIALPPIALALYPPTAFDATLYHLPFAQAFGDQRGLGFLAHLRYPAFPQLNEVLFVPLLELAGDGAAQLLEVAMTLATAALLLAWGRRLRGETAGLLAAVLWLGTPLVDWVGSAAYVSAGLALFATAGLFAAARYLEERRFAWALLCGALTGGAAATHYLGLFFVLLLGLAAVVTSSREGHGRAIVGFAAGALAGAGPWYLWIGLLTGNPVFPFRLHHFPPHAWELWVGPGLRASGRTGPSPWHGFLGRKAAHALHRLGSLATLPWRGIFDRTAFHGQAPLSPWLLVALPLGLPYALLERQARRLLLVAGVFAAFWLGAGGDIRYLLPVLPALFLALGVGLDQLLARVAHSVPAIGRPVFVGLLAAALVAPGPAYGLYKLVQRGPLPLSASARDEYLARSLAGYDAIAFLNRTEGARYTVYTLFGENLVYFARGRLLGDWYGPYRYGQIAAVGKDPARLVGYLERAGAQYLLVVTDRIHSHLTATAAASPRLVPVLSGPGFTLYRVASAATVPRAVGSRDELRP